MSKLFQTIRYTLIATLLFIGYSFSLTAQIGAIQGKVSDAHTGKPLPFVNITIETDFGPRSAQTNFDGFYHIKPMPVDTYVVVTTLVGYSTQNIKNILIKINETTKLNVQLQSDADLLNAVIVKDDQVAVLKTAENNKKKSPVEKHYTESINGDSSPPLKVKASAPRSASAGYNKPMGKQPSKKNTTPTKEIAALTDQESQGIHIADEINPIVPGQLTAGEIHDFSKWALWQDIAEETLKEWQQYWAICPTERYLIQLITEDGQAIVDQEVFLQTKQGNTLWTSRTDNTGKAELWANLFDVSKTNKKANLTITTAYNGQAYQRKAKIFTKGNNTLHIPMTCQQIIWADIAFVVDATGSMGDEIEYLKVELNDVIEKIKAEQQHLTLNLGSVFYRDEYEEYITKKSDFSTDPQQTIKFIQKQKAAGGGDVPEAVHSALTVAIRELKWTEKATARLLFLILDAPPHHRPEILKNLQQLTQEAAKKGIRIIPVTASDIDKDTEYLMRSMALATNGTYVFLTDDSGIGNPHLKPSTDKYKTETFNKLLIRLVHQYTEMPECSEKVVLNQQQKTNLGAEISKWLKYYPNPTPGPVTVEVLEDIPELYVTDLTGKLLQRFTHVKQGILNLDLSNYPSGMYLIRYPKTKNQWLSGKIIVTR